MSIRIFWDQRAPDGLQEPVRRQISLVLGEPVTLCENPVMLRGFDRQRKQCDAHKILSDMQDFYTRFNGCEDIILIVTSEDLYIPGRDFVFGLARAHINACIVSSARLKNGFYGYPDRIDELVDRLVKEGTHELCHCMGLDHCDDPECIMFYPQTLDELDRKKKALCAACQAELALSRDTGELI